MLKAVLFDLDNTLLINPLPLFGQAMFEAFARHLAHLVPLDQTISALLSVMQALYADNVDRCTNKEVFITTFCPAVGHPPEALSDLVDSFYVKELPKLRYLTQPAPGARQAVEWAFERGLQVVIATGMQGPRTLTEQRLEWAGVPVTDFDYALLTTWSNMDATKPNPAYYSQVLSHLDRQPDECLMVGDDWEQDIFPATSIGIPSYWIAERTERPPQENPLLVGRGTLTDLVVWFNNANYCQ